MNPGRKKVINAGNSAKRLTDMILESDSLSRPDKTKYSYGYKKANTNDTCTYPYARICT